MTEDSIYEKVVAGIDQFDEQRTIEIPLRDALFAYRAIGEFIRFFHDPTQSGDPVSIERFLGTKDSGGLRVLWEAYYERLYDVWPDDVERSFDDGIL